MVEIPSYLNDLKSPNGQKFNDTTEYESWTSLSEIMSAIQTDLPQRLHNIAEIMQSLRKDQETWW